MAINPLTTTSPSSVVASSHSETGTLEKIQNFLCRKEGMVTLFAILSGALVTALWGISFGLLAAASSVAIVEICTRFLCPPKTHEPAPPNQVEENRRNPQELERVERHLASLNLPCSSSRHLTRVLNGDFPQMDLCQIRLISSRPVFFDTEHRPCHCCSGTLSALPDAGYELNFETPNGPVLYYVDERGIRIAHSPDTQNFVSYRALHIRPRDLNV